MAEVDQTTPTTTEDVPEVVEETSAEVAPATEEAKTAETATTEVTETTNGNHAETETTNGDAVEATNGHFAEPANEEEAISAESPKEATKRKVEDGGDIEPVEVSAEKIAKLKEATTEEETPAAATEEASA